MQRTDLIDPDGENRALRSFLRFYLNPGITVGAMRDEMESSGWDGCWPEWVAAAHADTTLTKAGAQLWIRHLLSLEPAQAVPVDRAVALVTEARAVFDLMLVGCREQEFGDYQNGDGETIGHRMDELHANLRAFAGAEPLAAVDTDRIAALCRAFEDGVKHGIERDGENGEYDNPEQAAAYILGYETAATPGNLIASLVADKQMLDWLGQNFFASSLSDWDLKTTKNSAKWKFFAPAGVHSDIRNVLRAALERDAAST